MRSSFAVASLIVGIFCFVQFLGAEKAILAILFGILAFREIKKNEMSGKSLAIVGIVLGVIYIVIIIALIPYLGPMLSKLAVQG